jgi:hypothetical protein
MGIQSHPKALIQGKVCPVSYALMRVAASEIHIVVPIKCRRVTATNVFIENVFIV